jgi:polysaccharide export outer membrane protein
MMKLLSDAKMPPHAGILAWLALAVAVLVTCGTAAAQGEGTGTYGLNAGDVLRIAVWREEELSREVIVRPDGHLTFPLVGEIRAAGRTPEAVREEIVERLVEYIPDPVVTVSVMAARGNKVFVIGQVARPGEYAMDRSMTVIQALALAGGLGQFANGNRIQILRRSDGGEQRAIPFKYSDVESGDRLESNIELRSGDVIIVP